MSSRTRWFRVQRQQRQPGATMVQKHFPEAASVKNGQEVGTRANKSQSQSGGAIPLEPRGSASG